MINTSMFDSIKDAIANESSAKQGFANILRMTPENSYVVRLLPYIADPTKTFFHHYVHGWESFNTGKFMTYLSLQTFGETDPIADYRSRIYRHGTEEEKEKVKSVRRSEKWFANAYVVNDPTTPENNGTVKVIRFGKQLHNIITEAISGEDSEEFGPRIFDLSPSGCNLRIRVDKQGDFPSYVSSKFLMPSEIIDPADAEEIYNSAFDLSTIEKRHTFEELEAVLNEHILVTGGITDTAREHKAEGVPAPFEPVRQKEKKSKAKKETKSKKSSSEDDEELPMEFNDSGAATDSDAEEEKIEELLATLDDV